MDEKIRKLLEAYLEKAREKLTAAEVLLKNQKYDDAVSRAYYAAHHAAQASLLTEGVTTKSHQGLVNLFGLYFIKTGKLDPRYGKFLSHLKDDRENGDYEIFSSIDAEDAAEAMREAKAFVEAIEKFLKPFMAR